MSSQDNFIEIPLYGSLEKRNLMAICKSLGYDTEGYEIDWLKVTHVILKAAYCPALTPYITHDMDVGTLERATILGNNTALARLQINIHETSGFEFEYLDIEHHKHISSGRIKFTLQSPWFSTVLDFSHNNTNIAGIIVRLYFKGGKKPKRVVPHDLASLWNAIISIQVLSKEVVAMKDHPTKLFALYGKKFTGHFVLTKVLVDDVYVEAGDLILNNEGKIVKATESGKAIAVHNIEPSTFTYHRTFADPDDQIYTLVYPDDCCDDKQHSDLTIWIEAKNENGTDRMHAHIIGTFDPINKELNFTSAHSKIIGMVVDTSDITIISDNLKMKDEFICDGKSEKSMTKEPMLYVTASQTTKRKKKRLEELLLMMHIMSRNMNKGDV